MFSLIVSHAGALTRTVFAVEFIDGVAELAVEVTARCNATLQGDVVLAFALVDIRAACGSRYPDGQWRQIVTIEDALAGGCTLFNLDQLKQENSADDFRNLFMCEFVDDKASVFPFEELQRCMVDAMEEWEDFEQFADRPFTCRTR